MKKIILLLMLLSSFSFSKAKVGITLLPYYSYVKNIVEDKMEVVPVLPENIDVHTYQATANDIKKLVDLDYIVVNGIGHDEFVFPMIEIAKKNNKNLKIIFANKETTLLNASGLKKKNIRNPHTFISIQQSIEQVNYIAKKLSEFDPANRIFYTKNAIKYANKLRKIRKDELEKVKGLNLSNIKVATTHAGYDYLLNEFGLTVSAVVEPAHGQNPNANDLKNTIDKIKNNHILVLFDEQFSNNRNANIISSETGVKVAHLSHVTKGFYEKESFEKFIKEDLENISEALIEISKGK